MLSFAATPSFWRDRLQASGIHLGVSALIALFAAVLVFALWYPYPYRELSGGRELFLLVVGVDVVLGPLITLAVFNRKKPSKELRRDLAMVALLQIAALFYGLWTVFVARPVHMVFEVDRFRVVHAIDIAPELLAKAPEVLQRLPLTGPSLLALRPFKDDNERMELTLLALQGVQLSTLPDLWLPYETAKFQVLKAAKPLSTLIEKRPGQASLLKVAAQDSGFKVGELSYLPLVSRDKYWTMLIETSTGRIVNFVPIDPF